MSQDDSERTRTERALTELSYQVPSKEILIEQLGSFSEQISVFLKKLESIDFFAAVGKPLPLKNEKVSKVDSWEEALEIANIKETQVVMDFKFSETRHLIAKSSREEIADAAFYLYNEYVKLTLPQHVRGTVYFDIEGALNEIIVQDIGNSRFFLNLFDWYGMGHWPCGIHTDGTIFIF